MKIIEQKKNSILNREEVKVVVEAGKNPSFEEASKIIAGEFKKPEENIAIKQIKGKFGRNTFLISANIYESEEQKKKIEKERKKKEKEQLQTA